MRRRLPIACAAAAALAVAAWGPAAEARAATAELRDSPVVLDDPDEPAPEIGDVRPSPQRGAYLAKLLEPAAVYPSLDATKPDARLATRTRYTHSGVQLLVRDAAYTADGRLRLDVSAPLKPTGRPAWIDADLVRLTTTRLWVRVDIRRRLVMLLRNGRVVRRFRSVVGAPRTPTPVGLTAIYEAVGARTQAAFTGRWALHLTAFSRVLDRFGAGDGRAAIHGRGPTALGDPLGSARSHGCVRIDNAPIAYLRARLPLGAPVEIVDGRRPRARAASRSSSGARR
ncbi:L,D-transpeptidase [Patulibacter defluvii]|uniref:L,D-transpeptidase n=1 Tax=Patulibacter defluvii TaxID=3095358 RepID=UPI002A7636C8|nr:L,D-transpeptidase [Patulibacter sp. DM4]